MAKCYLYVIFKMLEMIEWTLTGIGAIFFIYNPAKRSRKNAFQKNRHKRMRLKFAKMHVDKPWSLLENILWTDKTKIEVFNKSYPSRPIEYAFKEKNILPVGNMEDTPKCYRIALLPPIYNAASILWIFTE